MKHVIILSAFSLCLNVGCAQNNNTKKAMENKPENTEQTAHLDSLLNQKKTAFLEKADPEKVEDYEQGIRDVFESGVVDKALNVNDKAPDFTLTNAKGNEVQLSEALKEGPVVLVWYRGGWCPYCNITLHYLQERLPDFEEHGATLMALSPEKPDKSLNTAEKNELEFEVLSDLDNQVAKTYGVVYELPEKIKAYYENGFGLSDYNGNDKAELPLAATYVIDQDGVIRYAFLDADYRERAEPDDIIKVLKEL